jgi:hypothetical protein
MECADEYSLQDASKDCLWGGFGGKFVHPTVCAPNDAEIEISGVRTKGLGNGRYLLYTLTLHSRFENDRLIK